jgi:molybdopterin molybdotransferase
MTCWATGVAYAAVARLPTFDEAQRLVLSRVQRLEPEPVPIDAAAGRFLAETARSTVDLPPFPSSAMDGFAVRSSDTPGELPIVFRVAAGRPAPRPLERGEAMAIATGGVVPEGADAVIPVEDVVERDNKVEIDTSVPRGSNIRPAGGDIRAGDPVVEAGTRLGPARIGALAAAGVAEVVCARAPRAAVLATGTELRAPGEKLNPGEIYEANGLIVSAQLVAAGAAVERLAAVTDDAHAHRDALERALQADVVVTTGGVSVGPHDLVRGIEAELGVEEVFWRVAVKPGKPVSFGVRERTLVFGLPGNPVSALVGFQLFVRPAVLALQGATDPLPRFAPGVLARAVRRNPERDELLRSTAQATDGATVVEPVSGQESHMIARAATADSLLLVPRGEGVLEAGSSVRYLALD